MSEFIIEFAFSYIEEYFKFFVIAGSIALFLFHLIVFEKYFSKEDDHKRVIKRDVFGAPIHMFFTVGDSLVFVGIFNYFKDIPKEQYINIFFVGIFIIMVGVVLYRLLHIWFEKKPVERIRRF
jgi:hypothetical protein